MRGRIDDIRARVPTRLVDGVIERTRIDTRALAAIRILAGVLLIADVLLRARQLTEHYTDEGALPRSVAQPIAPEGAVSVFWLTGDPLWVGALFALAGLVGVGLIVGYHTRFMTVLAFVLVISLDMRNILVLSYADTLFRLLLFWAIFLPLGERFSIDAVHRDRPTRASVTGLAPAMFLIQMIVMYLINGIYKTTSETWRSGEAAVLVFGIDEITFLVGDAFRAVPELLAIGGTVWFGLLVVSPVLLVLTGRWRAVLASAYALGHLSFAITVRIGAFPYVGVMGVLAFMPPVAWDTLDRATTRVGLGRRVDRLADTAAARARQIPRVPLGRAKPAIDIATRGAFVAVVLSFALLVVVLVPHVGLLIDPGQESEQEYYELLEDSVVGERIYEAQLRIGIAQPSWNIFAPEPRNVDRYYVFAAVTVDGQWYDLFNDRPMTLERPHDELQRQHEAYRDRFYYSSLTDSGTYPGAAEARGVYLCSKGHDALEGEIASITMLRVTERITADTIDDPDDRDRWATTFHVHACGGHEPEPYELPDDWG